MHYKYLNLESQNDLIEGVILKKLLVHKDETGTLVETLRSDWKEVFNDNDTNFAMQYMSTTPSAVARDEDKWHVHKHQKDRFICASGRIVTAIYDPREKSKTKGKINLFIMGPQTEEEMFMLLIPEETYHGFMTISQEKGYLLNFPTRLYNPKDEGRIQNRGELDWSKVRDDFKL